ncbi:MAG: prenyltransferase/squalene oxidase repeat-containing protein [Kiritimatiellia bacterium]
MDETTEAMEEFVEEGMRPEHEMMKLFDDLPFRAKVNRFFRGLKQPKDSGEYKWARLQLLRLSAPVSAVVVPIVALGLLTVFAAMRPEVQRTYKVQIMEPESMEELEEPLEPPEPIEPPPPPDDVEFTPDMTAPPTKFAGPPTDFSPQPAEFNAVALVKSPVIMKGIYGSRSPGARGDAMAKYDAPPMAEGAVLRALRWLKKNQKENGSWEGKSPPAMTALALMAFLAHGDTPASEEFGYTVQRAIEYLLASRKGDGGWNRKYTHAIVTYAICEAYALTSIPEVGDAAEKAIEIIIKGQNPEGGWRYKLNGQGKSDTSCMGWAAQALKAARMAGIYVSGMDECIVKAIAGFKRNYKRIDSDSGGFGYTGPGVRGLTSVGVLCLQLLGEPQCDQVIGGLNTLDRSTYYWRPDAARGKPFFNKNYYWYYTTQAMFHSGGDRWKIWNKTFSPVLIKEQTIIENGIEGPDGKMKDIGFWEMEKEITGHTGGVVMDTALCTLQLEVYYRYLPTFASEKGEDAEEEEGLGKKAKKAGFQSEEDVNVKIQGI